MSTLTTQVQYDAHSEPSDEVAVRRQPKKAVDPQAKERFDKAMHAVKPGDAANSDGAGQHSHKHATRHAKARKHDDHESVTDGASVGGSGHGEHHVHKAAGEEVAVAKPDSPDSPGTDTRLQERIANAVAEMLVSNASSSEIEVHMVFRQDFLPGVSVHVHRDANHIEVVFECGESPTRYTLERNANDMAGTIARRLGRNVAVSVKSSDTDRAVTRAVGTASESQAG